MSCCALLRGRDFFLMEFYLLEQRSGKKNQLLFDPLWVWMQNFGNNLIGNSFASLSLWYKGCSARGLYDLSGYYCLHTLNNSLVAIYKVATYRR